MRPLWWSDPGVNPGRGCSRSRRNPNNEVVSARLQCSNARDLEAHLTKLIKPQ